MTHFGDLRVLSVQLMLRKAPPLESVEIFVAAARGESFRGVARRLALSPSAVSRRISSLETFLGVSLFDRSRSLPMLSPAGRRYLALVEPALLSIMEASDLLVDQAAGRLRVATSHSFASAWLLPRLPALRREADIDVELIMTRDFEALRSGQAHIGIWGAKPAPDDLIAETLFEVTAVPVCAARLADGRGPPTNDSLDGYPLVAVRHPQNLWAGWLREPPCDVRTYDTLHMMYEAAAAGLGLALAVPLLAEPFLTDGRLRRCRGASMPLDAAYRLYRSGRRRVHSAPERAFITWIRREVARSMDTFQAQTAYPDPAPHRPKLQSRCFQDQGLRS